MRARRDKVLGWVVVLAFAALLAGVSAQAIRDPDLDRSTLAPAGSPAARFVAAWQRSREATFVASGTYERHSEVTGATITSEDVLAQRPPRRLHRQLGGVEGRDDDRQLVCPAPPAGEGGTREPCQVGPHGGPTYAESVAREVEALRSLVEHRAAIYAVTEPGAGCFHLELRRVDPRAPFGVEASFCFDRATGAPVSNVVRHEGGIVERLVVTSIRTDVTEADLTP